MQGAGRRARGRSSEGAEGADCAEGAEGTEDAEGAEGGVDAEGVEAYAASAAPSFAIASTCTVLAMGSVPQSTAYLSGVYAGAPVAE